MEKSEQLAIEETLPEAKRLAVELQLPFVEALLVMQLSALRMIAHSIPSDSANIQKKA